MAQRGGERKVSKAAEAAAPPAELEGLESLIGGLEQQVDAGFLGEIRELFERGEGREPAPA